MIKKGDIVTFENEPTKNTPGRPDSWLACTGVIVKDSYPDSYNSEGDRWCDVLWSSNQVTKCYKDDLKVWTTFYC